MKFLVIAPRFHTNLYYSVLSLQNKGHQVKVFVLYKGKSEYYKDIDIQTISYSLLSRCLIFFIRLFRKSKLKSSLEIRIQSPGICLFGYIRRYNPDVVLIKAYQDLLAVKSLLFTRILNKPSYLLIQTDKVHIWGSKKLFKLNMWLFKILGVRHYITPIFNNYEIFKADGFKNISYIPFVYPLQLPKLKCLKPKRILSIGKYTKRKAHDLLLKAFKLLIDDGFTDLTLVFYGEMGDENYFNSLKEYINNNNLQNSVILNTHVSYEQILNEYANYQLFVLPAYEEPAAYSIVEALSNGIPVICSTDNGTSCYIKEGINGYIFKSKDITELYIKIKMILLSENYDLIVENTLEIALENHAPDNFYQKLMYLFQK